MPRIGLVAGAGNLPLIFAREAKAKGETVIALALKGATSEELSKYADKVHWFEWGDLKKALFVCATERLNRIVLLGKIEKGKLFKESGDFDEAANKVVGRSGSKKDYAILKEIANLVKGVGVEIMDPTPYLAELIPSKGTLTKRLPGRAEKEDIEYGVLVAGQLAKFDIGQTVVIKDKTVIALEAAEGTNETIKRAGALIDGGFTVIKMARPDQDARFDIPLVGPETVRTVAQNRGSVLALESKKMLLMDRSEAVKIADENNISIVVV